MNQIRRAVANQIGMQPEEGCQLVAVPFAARGNVGQLAAWLYTLCQHGDCPAWVQGAARELCRDAGIDMVEARHLTRRNL